VEIVFVVVAAVVVTVVITIIVTIAISIIVTIVIVPVIAIIVPVVAPVVIPLRALLVAGAGTVAVLDVEIERKPSVPRQVAQRHDVVIDHDEEVAALAEEHLVGLLRTVRQPHHQVAEARLVGQYVELQLGIVVDLPSAHQVAGVVEEPQLGALRQRYGESAEHEGQGGDGRDDALGQAFSFHTVPPAQVSMLKPGGNLNLSRPACRRRPHGRSARKRTTHRRQM